MHNISQLSTYCVKTYCVILDFICTAEAMAGCQEQTYCSCLVKMEFKQSYIFYTFWAVLYQIKLTFYISILDIYPQLWWYFIIRWMLCYILCYMFKYQYNNINNNNNLLYNPKTTLLTLLELKNILFDMSFTLKKTYVRLKFIIRVYFLYLTCLYCNMFLINTIITKGKVNYKYCIPTL